MGKRGRVTKETQSLDVLDHVQRVLEMCEQRLFIHELENQKLRELIMMSLKLIRDSRAETLHVL